jgi:prevent-host-death family protein
LPLRCFASDALESTRRRDHIVVEMWCLFWRAYVETVGIRELKAHPSRHLKRVRSGVHLLVTERGRPIATISPADPRLSFREGATTVPLIAQTA